MSMKSAYGKDILRSIRKNMKRFLSIVIITALGITVLTGIYAACMDMRYSADQFYDRQKVFDIRILSTLGMTREDVEALQKVETVSQAEGVYSETVYTQTGELRQTAEVTVLSEKGINEPYLVSGQMPQNGGEIAVTQKYLDESGKTLGDRVEIEEDFTADADEEPNFLTSEFTITGVVIDPLNISNDESGGAFRSASVTDYLFFITGADVESDIFTSVSLVLAGAAELDCYSAEYESMVKSAVRKIETELKEEREQWRYETIMADARTEIEDAEIEMNEEFAKADQEFADAWEEWEEGQQELIDGENTLIREEQDVRNQLADARAELETGKAQLVSAEEQIAAGETELDQGLQSLQENKKQLQAEREKAEVGFTQAEQTFAEKQAELDAAKSQIEAGAAQLQLLFGEQWPAQAWDGLVGAAAARTAEQIAADPTAEPDTQQIAAQTAKEQEVLAGAIISLNDPAAAEQIEGCIQIAMGLGIAAGGREALEVQKTVYEVQKNEALQQLAEGESQLAAGEEQLAAGQQELIGGRAEIAEGWAQMADGEARLNEEEQTANAKLADAWAELEDGKKELEEARLEIIEKEEEYQEEKEDAVQKIADAWLELDDIDTAQWYVQDRLSVESFSGLKNDLSSIETVGTAFPVVFLLVAVLISLTTMTRLVEEERGLIGTYKAMGFSNWAIYKKYLLYALSSSLFGGILGDILGFAVLPSFLLGVLKELYIIPDLTLRFDFIYGLMGVLLFTVSIVGSAALACRNELRQNPSVLMRPKAPRAGSRVLLERIPFVWKNLKFLNKVTARNLFRYKKRLFMTVIGIMGCTALVLAGFAIKDSVNDLMPKQYQETYRYDLMLVADGDDNKALIELMEGEEDIEDYLNVQIDSITVLNESGDSETAQLIVIPDNVKLESYIGTVNGKGMAVSLGEEGILLTRNASEMLKVQETDWVSVQNLGLERFEFQIDDVVENYLGNNVYMSQKLYESTFGEYTPNGGLIHLDGDASGHPSYAEDLLDYDFILSSVSTQALRDDFSSNFAMVNSVLYLLIVLAAGLAFVVLFTLSNTNISERVRELATIKVLGFFDVEVHTYVNNETLILTALGVLAGLPAGRLVSGLLTQVLKMPGVYFAVRVEPASYVIAGLISFSFALIVNFITNLTLNRINMVEALKSVE